MITLLLKRAEDKVKDAEEDKLSTPEHHHLVLDANLTENFAVVSVLPKPKIEPTMDEHYSQVSSSTS